MGKCLPQPLQIACPKWKNSSDNCFFLLFFLFLKILPFYFEHIFLSFLAKKVELLDTSSLSCCQRFQKPCFLPLQTHLPGRAETSGIHALLFLTRLSPPHLDVTKTAMPPFREGTQGMTATALPFLWTHVTPLSSQRERTKQAAHTDCCPQLCPSVPA